MPERKPVGSGYLSLFFGILFLVALIASFFVNLAAFDPYVSFQVWLAFAGAILVLWGAIRVRRGDPDDYQIGQETLNFVVAVIGATVAILELIKP